MVGFVLAPALAAVAPSSAVTQDGDPSEYVTKFSSALSALDAGVHAHAAVMFVSAGEYAPNTPVWRVHAAYAFLLADEPLRAELLAVEAIRRGYPPSDLAAIDERLLPRSTVEIDLAPAEDATAPVVRLDPAAIPGRAEGSVLDDLAIVGSSAYDLVTGKLIATQRSRNQRVIGRVQRPGGEWEDVVAPELPGRWDHVDGRLLEQPSTGRPRDGQSLSSAVAALDFEDALRGLRTGFWVRGRWPSAKARFRGDDLIWSHEPIARTAIDLESLLPRTVRLPVHDDATIVDEAEVRADVGRVLGAPLEAADVVQRFEGVPYLVVTRSVSDRTALDRAPMLVVDLEAGEVVARPRLTSDVLFGTRPGPCVHADAHGVLFVSNASGSTIEAISTETWDVVWREPWQSGNGFAREITVRGDRVFSWATSPTHADVHDVRSGEPLFDGTERHVIGVDGSEDGRWVVARSWDAHYLLDGDDFEHVLEFWLEPSGAEVPTITAVGVDGTFTAPERGIREAHVLVGGRFVPAIEVAPWLWDPLHVRSLRDDADRAPRRAPVRR